VTSSAGAPIVGARVRRDRGQPHATAEPTVTDEEGRFALDPVAASGASVTVSAKGCQSKTLRLSADGPEEKIVLEPGDGVSGVVRDETGPVAGARIDALSRWEADMARPEDLEGGAGAVSDNQGKYELPLGADHAVTLRVIAPGHRVAREGLSASTGPIQKDFFLDRAEPFAGRVLLPEGGPAAGVHVAVFAQGGIGFAETAADGSFSVDRLPSSGPYEVRVTHGMYPRLRVTEESAAGLHEYRLEPASRILGRILDRVTRRPVTRYSYSVQGPSRMGGGAVSEHGAIEISPLAPGTYSVRVEAEGYGPVALEDVVLSRGATASGLEFLLPPAASVSGRVDGPWDGPMMVYAFRDGDLVTGAPADPSTGVFNIKDLPEGLYSLRAAAPGKVGEVAVRIAAGAKVEGVLISLGVGEGLLSPD
jgi:hypothetical protein